MPKNIKPKRARKLNPAVRILLVIALVYVAGNMIATCVKLQLQIREKKAEYSAVQAKITSQSVMNEQLNHILNAQIDSDYVESVARSMGYGTVGERVYENITDD